MRQKVHGAMSTWGNVRMEQWGYGTVGVLGNVHLRNGHLGQ